MSETETTRFGAALRVAATRGQALSMATAWLRVARVDASPSLDAQVLLAHVVGASRARIVAFPERALTPNEQERFAALVARRAQGEPVAYLTGHREFMGLDLAVDSRVLIPRPETELLVEVALEEVRARLAGGAVPVVVDVGTGSGAIAVVLAVLEPRLPRVFATDVSHDALAVAAENAGRQKVAERITLLQGDLLAPLPEPVDMVIANLPYVPKTDASILPRDVRGYEPHTALFGDEEGLGPIRQLLGQTGDKLRSGGVVALEFGDGQAPRVERLARAAFPQSDVQVLRDYSGTERIAVLRTSAHSHRQR